MALSMGDAPAKKRLWQLAWINVLLHALGLVFAAVGMRPGSPLADLDDRTAYLSLWPAGWYLGWMTWACCAVVLVLFFRELAALRMFHRGRIALGLATLGCLIDLVGDATQALVLPALARGGSPWLTSFLRVEKMASLAGLTVANGLYCVAILQLSLESGTATGLSRRLWLAGWGTFAFGMLLVAAGLTGIFELAALGTGPMIGFYMIWVLQMARLCDAAGAPA
jgi:hypothetical protein